MQVLNTGVDPQRILRIGAPQDASLEEMSAEKWDPDIFGRVMRASIICMTATALYGLSTILKRAEIDMVIMDEVSQCTEPLALPVFILQVVLGTQQRTA